MVCIVCINQYEMLQEVMKNDHTDNINATLETGSLLKCLFGRLERKRFVQNSRMTPIYHCIVRLMIDMGENKLYIINIAD